MLTEAKSAARIDEGLGALPLERATYARAAGVTLLIAVASVAVTHIGPSVIGGPRVTGTSDGKTIAAFYSHASMLPFWWQGGISVIAIVLFAALFRRYLITFSPPPMVAALIDGAAFVTVAACPLYALAVGLESAMVQLAAAGDAGRSALLGVFAAWDWTYNSFAYFFEAGYMAGWAIVAWRLNALPRWIAALGAITAVGHLFNSQVLLSHLSDNLTLIPTATFLLWFVSTGIFLARGGRRPGPVAG
ncbi:MAG: hypothetical protein NVS9B1_27690 [Candidatus Dormibacteraceae bacterium]